MVKKRAKDLDTFPPTMPNSINFVSGGGPFSNQFFSKEKNKTTLVAKNLLIMFRTGKVVIGKANRRKEVEF